MSGEYSPIPDIAILIFRVPIMAITYLTGNPVSPIMHENVGTYAQAGVSTSNDGTRTNKALIQFSLKNTMLH